MDKDDGDDDDDKSHAANAVNVITGELRTDVAGIKQATTSGV